MEAVQGLHGAYPDDGRLLVHGTVAARALADYEPRLVVVANWSPSCGSGSAREAAPPQNPYVVRIVSIIPRPA